MMKMEIVSLSRVPNPDVNKTLEYDCMNRLIKEKEIHTDKINKITHAVSHRYDYMGHKLATIDAYGNETQFINDPFGRVIQIIYPSTVDETGKIQNAVVKRRYDVLGNVVCEVDARGFEKSFIHDQRKGCIG